MNMYHDVKVNGETWSISLGQYDLSSALEIKREHVIDTLSRYGAFDAGYDEANLTIDFKYPPSKGKEQSC